jgi:hypothetical protein
MPTYDAADLKVNIDFECHVEGNKNKPIVKYQATVLFSSLSKLLERGGESVKRTLQTKARDGKFPTGRRVLVDEDGKYTQTLEDKVSAMSDAETEALFAMLQAKMQAKAAQEMAAIAEDEPKTQKVKGKK